MIRARIDPGAYTKAYALLWPTADHWPPEIDFAEWFGNPGENADRQAMRFSNHWRDGSGEHHLQNPKVTFDATTWHTIAVEWTPGLLVFKIDGEERARMTEHVPSEDMWLGMASSQASTENRPQRRIEFQVDWVAIYRPVG